MNEAQGSRVQRLFITFAVVILSSILVVFLAVVLRSVFAWTNPTQAPPGGSGSFTLTGQTLVYKEFTSSVPITATTEAGATTIVTADPYTFNGSTSIIIEVYISSFITPGTNLNSYVVLYDGASSLGLIANQINTAGSMASPVFATRRLTPSAGSHTYSARGYINGGAGIGSARAGPGGSGNFAPGYIRIVEDN